MRLPRSPRAVRSLFLPLLVPLLAAPPVLSAQEREIQAAGLPRSTVDHLLGIVHHPATRHLAGPSSIPADSVIVGDVVVMGDLRLAGRIDGELVVVHGDLDLERGAEVTGDLTVVDGEVRGAEEVRIAGTLIAYRRDTRYVQRGERGRHVATRRRDGEREFPAGARMRLSLQMGDYNRVEGLPVAFGPILDTGGANPLRGEARLVWRSQGRPDLARDRLGYEAEVRQFLGGRRTLHVGAGLHSSVTPIDAGGMTDRENFLSGILFRTDHRDYFERSGWRAFAGFAPRRLPVELEVEYRDEEHGSVGAGDPWSLFGDGRWRAQPLVAEGRRESVITRMRVDTRDDRDEPFDGWFVQAEWDQGVGGTLALPTVSDPSFEQGSGMLAGPAIDARYAAATLDVRRYHSLGRGETLALRAMVHGSPDGDILPPQAQRAVGGQGSLPGHRRFAADCGARSGLVGVDAEGGPRVMYPFYGCDRMALAQVEYRGSLGFDVGWGRHGDDRDYRHRPDRGARWAVFFDAAKGWAAGDWGELARPDTEMIYDAGLGLLLGRAGIYWAVPLGEGTRGSTLTFRLDPRF